MAIEAPRDHTYEVAVTWTGNSGAGTAGYRSFERAHEIAVFGKPVLLGSSDPAFVGDASRYNPEEMLVGSLSACHMLWYLHLCSAAGVVVTGYQDLAEGVMIEQPDGGGRFREVVLQPEVMLQPGADQALAASLHQAAHAKCFIANSVNFPIRCEPVFLFG